MTSRAVIAYPIGENEKTDLSNGVILQLADRKDTICGGRISWNTDDYGFTYTKGEYTGIDKLYIDNNHKLLLDKPENAIKVNVACYTLRDIRKGVSTEYPIVKIGAQYWMGKELHATTYRDGAPLKNRVTWEQTKPDITSRTNMTFILQWRIHTGRRAGSRGLENSIGCRLGTAEKLHRQRCLHTKSRRMAGNGIR